MIRSVGAVVAGVVAWFVVATIVNFALRALLDGYAAAEVTLAFTGSMKLGRLLLGLVSSLCAGFACAAISRSSAAPIMALAGLMLLIFIPMHLELWEKFPLWYHAFFLVTLAPAILLGAALWHRRSMPVAGGGRRP